MEIWGCIKTIQQPSEIPNEFRDMGKAIYLPAIFVVCDGITLW
jgi:hypothetical protein